MPTLQRWFEIVVGLAAGILVILPTWVFLLFVVEVLSHDFPAAFVSVICGAVILPLLYATIVSVWRGRRSLSRFARDSGWVVVDPASRHWPWTGTLHEGDPVRSTATGDIRVVSAWTLRSGGLPVTVGEIEYTGEILADTIATSDDEEPVFVIVRLPEALPDMAMRYPLDRVGDDSRLWDARVSVAFLRDEIPPWTVRGHELFTFQRCSLRPDAVNEAARRTLHLTQLLGVHAPTG